MFQAIRDEASALRAKLAALIARVEAGEQAAVAELHALRDHVEALFGHTEPAPVLAAPETPQVPTP